MFMLHDCTIHSEFQIINMYNNIKLQNNKLNAVKRVSCIECKKQDGKR